MIFTKKNNIREYASDDSIEKLSNYIIKLNPRIISFYTLCETFPLTCYLAKCISKKIGK